MVSVAHYAADKTLKIDQIIFQTKNINDSTHYSIRIADLFLYDLQAKKFSKFAGLYIKNKDI